MAFYTAGFLLLLFKIRFLHYLCIEKKGLPYGLRRRISGITRTEHYGMGSCNICILTMFVLACLRRNIILMDTSFWWNYSKWISFSTHKVRLSIIMYTSIFKLGITQYYNRMKLTPTPPMADKIALEIWRFFWWKHWEVLLGTLAGQTRPVPGCCHGTAAAF